MKFIAQVPALAPLKSDWKENVFWMSGGEEDRVQYWQARWATGQSQWNSEKPHQYLVKVRYTLHHPHYQFCILLFLNNVLLQNGHHFLNMYIDISRGNEIFIAFGLSISLFYFTNDIG